MSTTHAEIVDRLQELRVAYADAHRRGMDCLERRDLEGLEAVLKEEGQLIAEQAGLIQALRSSH